MIDLLGHLGYVALLVGQVLVARRTAGGFLLRVGGSLLWAALGAYLGLSSIVLWSLAFAAVDARAYVRWSRSGGWREPSEPE